MVAGHLQEKSGYYYVVLNYKDSNGKSWCVKTVKKTTTKGCPSGYTKDGNTCKKTETLNCTLK